MYVDGVVVGYCVFIGGDLNWCGVGRSCCWCVLGGGVGEGEWSVVEGGECRLKLVKGWDFCLDCWCLGL